MGCRPRHHPLRRHPAAKPPRNRHPHLPAHRLRQRRLPAEKRNQPPRQQFAQRHILQIQQPQRVRRSTPPLFARLENQDRIQLDAQHHTRPPRLRGDENRPRHPPNRPARNRFERKKHHPQLRRLGGRQIQPSRPQTRHPVRHQRLQHQKPRPQPLCPLRQRLRPA